MSDIIRIIKGSYKRIESMRGETISMTLLFRDKVTLEPRDITGDTFRVRVFPRKQPDRPILDLTLTNGLSFLPDTGKLRMVVLAEDMNFTTGNYEFDMTQTIPGGTRIPFMYGDWIHTGAKQPSA